MHSVFRCLCSILIVFGKVKIIMPCTTILAGRRATFDGSTMTARNEDSASGTFNSKKFTVVLPEDQPAVYHSVISKCEIPLPSDPLRYTAMPNATDEEGIWAAAGVNAKNISMTATETITSNERVLAADPLVKTGIGEEDMVTVTLPYISSAREGVIRLGSLLETYGTYEMNGIAFQDINEVWWLETVGGHHWIAKRVPDDHYVIMPNSFGIDQFDLKDAFTKKKDHMCSQDLRSFIADNHLDLTYDDTFNARLAFGSHTDADHVYNTPRAWYAQRYFNPKDTSYTPYSDDIPWSRKPEHKITVEDVKYVLSSHYQSTPYDCYAKSGDLSLKGSLRPIGISRNNFLSLVQIRPYVPDAYRTVEWIAFGSNVFNAFGPLYANIDHAPKYFGNTCGTVTTESFYWANRIIAALADPHFSECAADIGRYRQAVQAEALHIILEYDRKPRTAIMETNEEANAAIEKLVREKTDSLLDKVLYKASCRMKNGFSRSDG